MKIAAIGGGTTKYWARRTEIGSVPWVTTTTKALMIVTSTGPHRAG
jgi:hypothetical protein